MSETNLFIYNQSKVVPSDAQKPIKGGRLKGMTDINPMWRIKKLTELFGPCGIGWYYKEVDRWTVEYKDEVCAFVNIELYINVDNEWSMPIHGTGGSKLAQKESSGVFVSDECFKMATTDALSVACKQLGIGADIYWKEDKSKYPTAEPNKEDERIAPILKELKRTGYSNKAVCKAYNVQDVRELSNEQIADFLEKAKDLPTKG